ncbi:MAG: CRTAC1 family protein, partial [Myxococcota bacterium]
DDGSSQFQIPFAGMGVGLGDVNGDEVPDFLQSSWRDTSLLLSVDGAWWEYAANRGIEPDWKGPRQQIFGWGAELADMDLDGDLDGVIVYGHWDEYGPQLLQVDALYIQKEDGTFEDKALEWQLDQDGIGRGMAISDLNQDGYPDVVKRHLGAATPMLLSECGDRSWLNIKPRQPGRENVYAVGARVRVVAGDTVWTRTIHAGSTSMYSSGPPEALFGLNALPAVDTVEVIWPDGASTVLEGPVTTRQILEVHRSQAPLKGN